MKHLYLVQIKIDAFDNKLCIRGPGFHFEKQDLGKD